MPETPDYIKQIIDDEQRLRTFWQARTEHLRVVRQARNLEEAALLPNRDYGDMMKVIDSHPQNWWLLAVAAVANEPLRWRVPILAPASPQTKDGKGENDSEAKFGKLEKLCYAIDWSWENERTLMDIWRYRLALQIMHGWYAVMPTVKKLKDGGVKFGLEFWDPMTVFQSPDMKIVVRSYMTTLAEARAHVRGNKGDTKPLEGDGTMEVRAIDYWCEHTNEDGSCEVYNAFAVTEGKKGEETIDRVLALPYNKEPFDEIPLETGACGGFGPESSDTSDVSGVRQRWGASILDSNLRGYQHYNDMLTLERERGRQSLNKDLISTTKNAQGFGEEEAKLGLGKRVILHGETGEDIKAIDQGSGTREASDSMVRAQQSLEQGSVPNAYFGVNSPSFAAAQLEQALSTKAGLRLGRYVTAYKMTARKAMLRSFRIFKGLNATARLEGKDLRKRGVEGVFSEEFSSDDFPKFYYIEPVHKLTTIVDENQIANREIGLVEAGIHELERAMDATGVEDTHEALVKIMGDQARKLVMGPIVALAEIERQARSFEDAGMNEMAEMVRFQADKIRESILGEMEQKAMGAAADQPNARPERTLRSPNTVATPVATGSPVKQAPASGAKNARMGNKNAQRNGAY